MRSTLLRGGSIVDGTGRAAFTGDVLLVGDRIVEVGQFAAPLESSVIDCSGLTIAPGFIDAHSHSDLQVLEDPPEKLLQGVTGEVVGNCGFSPYPACGDRGVLHEFANGIFCGDGHWGWASARDYLDVAARAQSHVASLVGHGTLRVAVAGMCNGPLDQSRVDAMEHLLAEALSGGACGFSTGLMYAPGEGAPVSELERLLRVVARHGKTYATHMRDYSSCLVEAVEEQVALARHTGCRLQISHFQAVGTRNWHLQAIALEKIESARDEGLDVAFDCYPYLWGSTVLTQLLPQFALEGGMGKLLAKLGDRAQRQRIAAATAAKMDHDWTDLLISAGPNDVIGMSMAEIAAHRGRSPMDTVFDLLMESEGAVNILERNQSEENLRRTLSHPLSVVISDGFYVKGRPHPRLHGTFPLFLGRMCRKLGWIDLPEAVRKITSAPAERFGMVDRGSLKPGCVADVTVFDAGTIDSPASYASPEELPVGIAHVFARGVHRLAAGQLQTVTSPQ